MTRDRYGEPQDTYDDPKYADKQHAMAWINHIRQQLTGTPNRPDLAAEDAHNPEREETCHTTGESSSPS